MSWLPKRWVNALPRDDGAHHQQHCSMSIKQLGEGVIVGLLEGGALSAALVAMTAVGTEPYDRASSPVAVVIDTAGDAAAVVPGCSFASVTRRVPLGRSPRWR